MRKWRLLFCSAAAGVNSQVWALDLRATYSAAELKVSKVSTGLVATQFRAP
jgi:hypothetical protein